MNDHTTPNTDPAPDPNHPPEDDIEMNGGGYKKLWMLVVGFGGLAILTLALLLPALANAPAQNPELQNTTQVRRIAQSLVIYAGTNKEKMPGVNSKGYILQDDGTDNSLTGRSGHGGTVEARFWLLLDSNMFSGEYAISPAETKTVWTTGQVTSANYSYALLNIHSVKDTPPNDKTRPDQSGRAREWKQTISTQAVLIADRARIPGGHIGDNYDKIYSVHTSEDDAEWAGSVGRGDGSASFDYQDTQDTKYGAAPTIQADRLFSLDQDTAPHIDILTEPNSIWDDKSNALLGYTSVGYEDDDIASD